MVFLLFAFTESFGTTVPSATVKIQLRLEDGFIRVDFDQSRYQQIDAEFKLSFTGTNEAAALRQLLDYVDGQLKSLGTARQYLQATDARVPLSPETVDRGKLDWPTALQRFSELAEAQHQSENLLYSGIYPKLFSSGDDDPLKLKETPLRLADWDPAEAALDPNLDAQRLGGFVLATVTPPYAESEWAANSIKLGDNDTMFLDARHLVDAINRQLHPLVGRLWWNREVRKIAEDYLAASGYSVADKPSLANAALEIDARTKTAKLQGALPVKQVVFSLTGVANPERLVAVGLYNLLPTPLFQRVNSDLKEWIPRDAGTDLWRLDFTKDPAKSAGIIYHLDAESLPMALPRLAEAGLGLDPSMSMDSSAIALLATAPLPAKDKRRPKEHFLTIQFTSQPRRPHDVDLTFQKERLTGNDSMSFSGGVHDIAVGGASYTRDYIGFGKLGRRLRLTAEIQKESDPDRRAGDESAVERRNEGSLTALLELWRNRDARWLNCFGSVGYARSEMTTTNSTIDTYRALSGSFGFDYKHGPPESGVPYETAEFTSRIGSLDSNRGTYEWARLNLARRSFTFGFVQLETRAQGWIASGSTPLVERPSLGGEASVRGFRRDASIGRTLWSLQNEVWLPIRFDLGLPAALAQSVRRKAHVAVFADLGAVDAASESLSTIRRSAGAGLRVTHGSITFRLDWAHALNATTAVPGGSFFYFSLTAQPSF